MQPRAFLPALILFCAVALRAADVTPPTVQSITPAPNATLSNLTQVTVTFSEAVVGVLPTDLLINEVPALSRAGGGATWTFFFSQPAAGPVAVDFDADAGITDAAGNPFDSLGPGTSWMYTLADTTPPAVARTAPVQGASVTALTQLEVVFTEAVSGVRAADLLINGSAASAVTSPSADRYLFQFAQPLNGAVTISWAAGHGIQDVATTPNGFSGTGWSYTLDPSLTADVVINEFLADNLNSLADADEQKGDWIELRNRGASSVNLLGWSLSDDAADLGKWTFPAITLGSGQYLVIFATGKDRKTTAAGMTNHASFTLPAGGGYLALCRPEFPRVPVSEFAAYPEQRADVSYGLTAGNTTSYFSVPTPGAANNTGSAVSGFVLPPHASVESGFFNQPFNLVLASDTPGATVRYTLDGSVPGPSNTLYTAALSIAGTAQRGAVTVRAVAFKTGLLPSMPITRTFIFPEFVLMQPANPPGFPLVWDSPCTIAGINCQDAQADYEMDPQVLTNNNYAARAITGLLSLPTISIMTHTNLLFGPALGVYVRREPSNQQPVSVEMIHPDGSSGFNVTAGLEVVGGTSPNDQGTFWKSRKLNMRLIFRGEFGPTKLRYRVFPDSTVEEYDTLIVDAGSNYYWTYNGTSSTDDQRQRATYVRDQYVADLQNAMGRTGPHGRYVHVYLNGLYWGLHCLHERPDHSFSASHFGGDKSAYDVIKHRVATVVNGTNTNYTAMHALSRSGLASNPVYEQLQTMLDMPWYIDYMILNHYVGNDDWAHQNWYCARAPGKGWRYLSWDAEHSLKNLTYNSVTDLDAGDTPTAMFQLLRTNPEFRLRFADHVHRHFFNGGILHTPTTAPLTNATLLAANRPASLFMRRINEVDAAMVPESARWGDTGETGTSRANNPLTRDREWFTEVEGLMGRTNLAGYSANYFPLRASTVLNQMLAQGVYTSNQPPVFSQHGGAVPFGYALYMTNVAPGSTIYFTTNGADPRVYGSGAVSGQASTYTGTPVVLERSTLVKARSLLNGTNWSALNEAVFTIGAPGVPMRITEVMYNPAGGAAFEFVELLNAGLVELNIGGYSFEGIGFTFPPGFTAAAGARIVLASDENPGAFAARYPGVLVAGYFSGSLDNGGERLALLDAAGNTVVSVDYRDDNGWPAPADGAGYSLEIIDAEGNPDDPANWRASTSLNGTAGQPPGAAPEPAIVLNEVMAENLTTTNNSGTFPDYIELRNASASPVNLTGWSLTDNGDPRRFVFTNGPVLAPGGFLLIWCDTNSAAPGMHTGFALDRDGSGVFLYDANTNRADALTFGRQMADFSLSRVNNPEPVWAPMSPTPGRANTSPPLPFGSSLRINEWLANAPPGQPDWIELYSPSFRAFLEGVSIAVGDRLFTYKSRAFLEAGGFVRLYADEEPGPAHLDLKLPAAGATIILYDRYGAELDRVTYGAQAQGVSSGRLPDGSATVSAFPGSASPAAPNYVINYTGPVLNEVMAKNSAALAGPWGDYSDWIEFYNPNPFATNIGGMRLGTAVGGGGAWTIPAGTSIGANSYLIVYCTADRPVSTNAGSGLNAGFNLSADGSGLYLFNAASQIVNQVHFGFQIADRSIGLSGGQWRLLDSPTPGAANSATAALGGASGLRINEWMSNPARGKDWFELFNTNALPVDLGGLYLTDDPSIAGVTNHPIAPLSFIAGGGWVKFTADGDAGAGPEHVNFSLDALGDALRLYSASQALIDSADLAALPSGVSQGRLPDGGTNIVTFPVSSTPAAANYLPLSGVTLSEVLTRGGTEDAVELANLFAFDAGIGGWFLSDSETNLRKYQIGPGTSLATGGFIVFTQSQFGTNTDPGALVPFAFDGARGGSAYLSAADGGGNLTGYRSQFAFGAARAGEPFARYGTSVGADFPAASALSLDTENPGPRIGPVVINELMYHPVTLVGTNLVENETEEFIELHNLTTNAVALYDTAHPSNTWRLAGGVQFGFPAGVSLGSRSFLLVVNFDPADAAALAGFRAKYGVAGTVPVFGPYAGKLDNDGEAIELFQPDAPLASPPDAGFVPQILVDRIEFASAAPWPAEGAGTGASLQRRRPHDYGNDPVNWKGEPPTTGRANVPGSSFTDADGDGLPDDWEAAHGLSSMNPSDADADPDADGRSSFEEFLDGTDPQNAASHFDAPSITAQPQSLVTIAGSNVTFSVSASGTAPLRYQWRLNGAVIPDGTNAVLQLNNVQTASAGTYSATVLNDAGFALSQAASLVVNIPPAITVQPTNQVVNPNASATFNVSATGTGVVRYQWLYNGSPIPGATNTAFTTNNVTLASEGEFVVHVTDDIATVASQPARLIVKVVPVILVAPIGQTNPVGASATFTVRCSGSVPMTFTWRKGGSNVLTRILLTTNDTLTFPSLELSDSNSVWRILVTNYATLPPVNAQFANAVWPVTAITVQPTNRTVLPGASTTFNVAAASHQLRYQWFHDGAAIAGATNAALTLTNIQPPDAGGYSVLVSNIVGTATSQVAMLVVLVSPQLTEPEFVNGMMRFKLLGNSNQAYYIEASTNLVDWPTLTNLLTTNALMPFIDGTSPGVTNRFYRARIAE